MIGIYAIENTKTKRVYVGQSVHIHKRFSQHLRELEKGTHHSQKLQEAFDEHGAESFTLTKLEIFEKEQLHQKESEWIIKFDALENGYNMKPGEVKFSFSEIKNRTRVPLTFFEEKILLLKTIIKRETSSFLDALNTFVIAFRIQVRIVTLVFLIGFVFSISLSFFTSDWKDPFETLMTIMIILIITTTFMTAIIHTHDIEEVWERAKKKRDESV
jgi:hypothetical protein